MKKPEHIQIRVEAAEKREAERAAAEEGRSLSAQVRLLITAWLRQRREKISG